MSPKPKQKVSWKRVGTGLLIAFVGFWVLDLVGMHVLVWYEAYDEGREHPELFEKPQSLFDLKQADLGHGVAISRDGYTLRVPWPKIKSRTDLKSGVSIAFGDGSSLLMLDPSGAVDSLAIWRSKNGGTMPAMHKVLGERALRSNYDLTVAEMESTPTDVSLFHSRARNVGAFLLLMYKSTNMVIGHKVFSIESNGWRGFEVLDPGEIPLRVRLILFNAQDRKLEMILQGPKSGRPTEWNQETINALVASIQPSNSACMKPTGCS